MALSKLEAGVPVLCVGKVRARTPEDSERTYAVLQPEGIRAVSMDEVSHWAIKACDKLNTRINANKAFGNDDDALKEGQVLSRSALNQIAQCRLLDDWPSWCQAGVKSLSLPRWAYSTPIEQ